MSARDELAEVLKKAGDNESLAFQFNMKYWGPIADTVLAAGFVKAGAAEALLEEIRALVAADALVPSSNTHYELRALLKRNPA